MNYISITCATIVTATNRCGVEIPVDPGCSKENARVICLDIRVIVTRSACQGEPEWFPLSPTVTP